LDRMGLSTKIEMQYNHGKHSSKDAQADNEYKIHHCRHMSQALFDIIQKMLCNLQVST